jgi:hypothetical protein
MGQLGNGMPVHDSSVPVRVRGITGAVSITADGDTGYSLLADGTVLASGENYMGQLGNGSNDNSSTPVQVRGLAAVGSITASNGSAFALLKDGTVRAWGGNIRADERQIRPCLGCQPPWAARQRHHCRHEHARRGPRPHWCREPLALGEAATDVANGRPPSAVWSSIRAEPRIGLGAPGQGTGRTRPPEITPMFQRCR